MHATKTTTTRRAADAPDCTAEDAAAYSAFYEKHYRSHVRVLHHLYPRFSWEEAEDIIASTYMKLWRDWPKLRGKPDKTIRVWVDKAMRNRANDLYRRKQMIRTKEYTRDELHTLASVAGRGDGGTVHSEEADPLAIITEYMMAHDAATDPEHWAVERATLAELKQSLHPFGARGERMWRVMLAGIMGYSSPEIGDAQGRSASAVKMDMMRARELMGIPKKAQMRTNCTPTYTVTIRKGAAA